MIKINRGRVASIDGSKEADIIVKAAAPNDLKQILIGGGTVLVGIIYLTVSAFKRGAKAYESAELNALADIGAMDKQDVKEILENDEYFTK
jgi:hypothetical protein